MKKPMKLKRFFALALLATLLLTPVWTLANGSIRPWLLNVRDSRWSPVDADRLDAELFYNNGNIITKYHANTGVLYHSYRGNPAQDCITNKTFLNVIIHPPQEAQRWVMLLYQNISLTDDTLLAQIQQDLENPPQQWVEDLGGNGFPYYERPMNLFNRRSTDNACTPMQLASQGRGNLFLAGWYDGNNNLIKVEWLVETADDFSVPKHDVSAVLFDTYAAEADVPSPVVQPSLINPKTPNPTQFRLLCYYYPSYRQGAEYAELLLIDPYGNVVPELGQPLVFYWPYPEGHGYGDRYSYRVRHYLDSSLEKYEMLDITRTSKGLRIVTDSFSPFELSWSESAIGQPDSIPEWEWYEEPVPQSEALPATGDSTNVAFLAALAVLSLAGMAATLVLRSRNPYKE